MYNKILILLAGAFLISLGIGFRKYGWDHLHGFPVPKSTGILVIIVGFLVILFALFQKTKLSKSKNRRILHWSVGHYRKSSNLFTSRNTKDAKGFMDSPNPDYRRVKNLLKIKRTFRFFNSLTLNRVCINHCSSQITMAQQQFPLVTRQIFFIICGENLNVFTICCGK